MKNDKLYLVHISECIMRIEKYVVDGKEVFMTSTLIQDAVSANLGRINTASFRCFKSSPSGS
jgi:uncharacterized protein with HEPN domain